MGYSYELIVSDHWESLGEQGKPGLALSLLAMKPKSETNIYKETAMMSCPFALITTLRLLINTALSHLSHHNFN